jgi:hypothetical protein
MPDPIPAAPPAPAPAPPTPAPAAPPPPAPDPTPTPPPAPAAPAVPPTPAPAAPPAAPPAPPAAPVLTLKLPDGSKLDAQALERTTAHAVALGLSPESAQKTLELVNAEVAAFWKAQETQSAHTRNVTWVDEVKADPDIGGANFDQTMKHVTLVKEQLMDPDFRQWLNESGMGNHRWMVRFIARVGRRMADANLIGANALPGVDQQSAAQKLYGKTQPA